MKAGLPFLVHFLLILCSKTAVSQIYYDGIPGNHDTIAKKGHYFFMHTPQIEVIDSGDQLPNNQFAHNRILIVSAIGGEREGGEDQDMWFSRSIDNGVTWTIPRSLSNFSDTFGLANVFNATLFKTKDNILHQFYLWNEAPNGGPFGNFPIFLKRKVSYDGGSQWVDSGFVKIRGIPDSTTFRIIGPFCKPIKLDDDSLFFPIYYRYVGSPNAFFATLKCDTNLRGFNLKLHPHISYPHPNRLIEPCAILKGNVIKVYFRSGNGYVCTAESNDQGSNWQSIVRTLIPNPGTLISSLPENDGVLCSNINGKNRNFLCLFKESENGVDIFPVDNLAEGMEQVTYPSLVKDKSGNIHIAYSGIGLSLNDGLRFGNIYYKQVNSSRFERCNLPLDTSKANFQRFMDYTKFGSFGQAWSVSGNNIYKSNDRGHIVSNYEISAVTRILDVIELEKHKLLLLTNMGLCTFDTVTKNLLLVNNSYKSGKIKKIPNLNKIFHYVSRSFNILTSDNYIVNCSGTIPSTSLDPSINSVYGNISDATYRFKDSSFYIVNDYGEIFKLSSFCSSSLFQESKISLGVTSISIINDSICLLDRSGNSYLINITNPNGRRINSNLNSSNSYLNFYEFDSVLFAMGTNSISIFENGKLKANTNTCALNQYVSLLNKDSNYIYFLDNFSQIDSLLYKLKGNNNHVTVHDTSKFLLYPNPADLNQFISNSHKLMPDNIEIYNLFGKKMPSNFSISSNGDFMLIDWIPSGVYILNFTSHGINYFIRLKIK